MRPEQMEERIVNRLIDQALKDGLMISVYDGEEFALKRSKNRQAIKDAMRSTEYDALHFRKADGEKIGVVALIYGNGEDVISDHSDNPAINDLVSRAMNIAA